MPKAKPPASVLSSDLHIKGNIRTTGDLLKARITKLSEDHPGVVKSARGLGFMLGIELQDRSRIRAFSASDKPASIQFVNRLHEAGVLTIPSGTQRLQRKS